MKFPIIILLLLFVSCGTSKKEKKNSNKNQIESISWIKEYIEKTKENPFPTKAIITQYLYKNEIVFLVEGCYQCPDSPKVLYNKKKEQLCVFGGMLAHTNNCPDFFKNATDKKIIWKNFN
ncbi:DUF6970 domain-containing protein [Tenacibaculum sp. ZS6-P6]|uniref:DUF6970 domain-containing protein n=1 Tax=Tenacibaculum sp. ZS6-P6 TaxID=3447503 RepID=UPI003F94A875